MTLKILLIVLVYVVLFVELKNYDWSIWQRDDLLTDTWWICLSLSLLLMPINWLVESVKWQYLTFQIERIALWTAIKAVFAGMAISIFTPNRVGDYLGRIFILKKGDRWDGVVATIVGNVAQLLVTLVMGSVGLVFFAHEINNNLLHFSPNGLLSLKILAFVVDIAILFIYFNTTRLEQYSRHWLGLYKYPFVKHLRMLSRFGRADLMKVALMSWARYMIYATQYYLLFLAFGMQIGYGQGIMLVSVLFFALTIVPTVAVAELGVRGLLSVYIIQLLSVPAMTEAPAVAASSALWMINIALPALLGGIFVFDLKFLRPPQHTKTKKS